MSTETTGREVNTVTFGTAVLLMLIGAAIGTGIGAGYAHSRFLALQQEIDRTAPIAIIQMKDFIEKMPGNPSKEDMKAVYRQYGAVVDRLSAAGYLVLDAQAVAGAPEDLYVPTPD